MDIIRAIKESDYPILDLYWAVNGSNLISKEVYPEQSSYIFERDGHILYAVALHKIEGLNKAFVEYFIRNPYAKSDFNAVKTLQNYIEIQAKSRGVTTLYGLTKDIQVHEHHGKIGYECLPVSLYLAIRRL